MSTSAAETAKIKHYFALERSFLFINLEFVEFVGRAVIYKNHEFVVHVVENKTGIFIAV
jgi:hypothetical protein